MRGERKAPKRRFKEFQHGENWECSKVGEFYDFKNGLNKSKKCFGYGIPIVNFTDVFHNRGIYISQLNGKVNLNCSEISNFRVKQGDIFFTRTSETIDEIGYSSVMLDNPTNTVFSGFVLRGRARDKDPLTLKFKRYAFFTKSFRNEMILKSSMTTRALTSGRAIKNMYVKYPVDKQEQDKIGAFFEKLDNIITLNQRKLEKLKALKKAYLTQMFPAKGESKPKLRFAGFNDEWEECKIEELGEIITGSTPPTQDKSNYGEDYLLVSPIDINSNRYIENTETKLSSKGFNLGRSVKAGSTLFVSIGSTIGKVAQVKQSVVTNQQINSIVANEKYNSDFIYSLMVNKSEDIRKLAATQAVPIINKTTFSNVEVLVSSDVNEQQKIGEFFVSLDNIIEVYQCKLEKLQNLKKAYLNEMFV